MHISTRVLLVAGIGVALAGCSRTKAPTEPTTFEEARAWSASRNVPLLVDFFADW
ncbi:MAG: hypothetical protein QF819_00640 [Gemmatimonadota bacterium]|jgi:recombinational DNA repair protein (RecF pathway)|nr:hypothetical protein [Gemmatimonadota bacterium]MDP6528976.1 hypothetical protein [Gemmatimonadota bacterium]MDP6801672.1 hypothetical protein [Gemmatimonadota bacterium]MDP7030781.1 hypothetical protein [Gemmatimonadota bacterium]